MKQTRWASAISALILGAWASGIAAHAEWRTLKEVVPSKQETAITQMEVGQEIRSLRFVSQSAMFWIFEVSATIEGRAQKLNDKNLLMENGKTVELKIPKAPQKVSKIAIEHSGRGAFRVEADVVPATPTEPNPVDASEQRQLGRKYETGEDLPKDLAKAVYWYRKSAEQGYAEGQCSLAWMYSNGAGVVMDKAEAAKWYRKAADQGHARARNNLGHMFLIGDGVAKDEKKGIVLLQQASAQGFANAQAKLKELGQPVQPPANRVEVAAAPAPPAPSPAPPAPAKLPPPPPAVPAVDAAAMWGRERSYFFDNFNKMGVGQGAARSPEIVLQQPTRVQVIGAYHWNGGKGAQPGTLGLRDQAGRLYGPWKAYNDRDLGGPANVSWVAFTDILLPAGKYSVVDSDVPTWAHNPQSGGLGFARAGNLKPAAGGASVAGHSGGTGVVGEKQRTAPVALSLPEFIPALKNFREAAILSPPGAFARYADAQAQTTLRQLGDALCPASDAKAGWSFFFGTSIASLTSLSEQSILVMFYNPWADVALLCEWANAGQGPKITKAELVVGDILRDNREFLLTPLWRRANEAPPPLAVVMAASDTVDRFLSRFGAHTQPGRKAWLEQLGGPYSLPQQEGNRQAAGVLFGQVLASIDSFFNETGFARVNAAMGGIRQKLLDGRVADVLAMAPDTGSESRRILSGEPLDWQRYTLVSFAMNPRSAFVFLADFQFPEVAACFWFNLPSNGASPSLRRIDFFTHSLSRDEVNAIVENAGLRGAP